MDFFKYAPKHAKTIRQRLAGQDVAGGSVDIYKCFDQVNRKLVQRLAEKAGMPKRILEPYMRYIDNLQIRYQVADTIGLAHAERCSIPQGCPFSMTMVALLMRPWVKVMAASEVQPRVLADDLMFHTSGEGHRARTVRAMEQSRQYFNDIGAKVAANKCFTFATDTFTRNYLTKFRWKGAIKIPNASSFRDLGAHMNLTKAKNGATLTQRLHKATNMAKKLRWMPLSKNDKEKIIRCNVLPAALYGVETATINNHSMNALRSAIADAIGPQSAKRSLDLVFATTCTSKTLDPNAHVLYQRVAGLRRMMAKHPGKQAMVRLAIKRINATCTNPGDHDDDLSGPVAILINNLKQHGCTLKDNLIIQAPHEADIDVWNMPWQHLKTAIMDLVVRDQIRKVDQQRTFCGKIEELDLPVLNAGINRLGEKEQRAFKYVATGAYWNDKQLEEIQESDGMCQHCGLRVMDSTHLLWKCPAINKHRQCKDLNDLDTDKLPSAMLHGLPAAMTTCMHGAFWHHQDQANNDQTKGCATIGEPNGRMRTSVAQSRTAEINTLMEQTEIDETEKLSARQAFTLLKQDKAETTHTVPYKCTMPAPDDINVFSDGSWLHPSKIFLGMGGAGVWWPGRTTVKDDGEKIYKPLSNEEKELAFCQLSPEGLRLYTKIGGYNGHSTRTELAAGIIAICAYGPVHIGSDSKAFVDAANGYLRQIARGKKPNKPWKTVSDGDLWEHFWLAATAKDAKAIKISWVKGHATSQHVEQGVTTDANRKGNHKADEAAEAGNQIHGAELIRVANFMHLRLNQYQTFFNKVVVHITEAYLIHRKLIDDKEAIDKAKRDKDVDNGKVNHKALQYACEDRAKNFKLTAPLTQFQDYVSQNHKAQDVNSFLVNLKYLPAGEDLRPITWLEMYILYRCRGGQKPIKDPEQAAQKRGTADKQIKAFKKSIREWVKKVMHNSEDSKYFKPYKPGKDALIGMGMMGKHASIACNVAISDAERTVIADWLVKLTRTISKNDLREFRTGAKKLKANELKLKGKVGWDSTIPILTHNKRAIDDWETAPRGLETHDSSIALLKCPVCDYMESNSCNDFQYHNLDKRHKCFRCKNITCTMDWNCVCGYRWYNCKTHCKRNPPETTHRKNTACGQSTTDSSKTSCKRPKRSLPALYEDILDDDLKRANLKRKRKEDLDMRVLDLGKLKHKRIKMNFLSPKLRSRFMGSR